MVEKGDPSVPLPSNVAGPAAVAVLAQSAVMVLLARVHPAHCSKTCGTFQSCLMALELLLALLVLHTRVLLIPVVLVALVLPLAP
eukprot:5178764-Pyramimonas_sp.AAC.1